MRLTRFSSRSNAAAASFSFSFSLSNRVLRSEGVCTRFVVVDVLRGKEPLIGVGEFGNCLLCSVIFSFSAAYSVYVMD